MAGGAPTVEATPEYMRHPEHAGARKSRLGRMLARVRQRRQARHEAEQSLASILEAGGNTPLPPTPTERILKAGGAALHEQVARSPRARRLAEAARRRMDEAETAAPGRLDRALHGPRQVFNGLRGAETDAAALGLPGAAAHPALAGPPVHAGHAAALLATRYGAHLLVLAVVLLVIFAGGTPALHARITDEQAVSGPNDGFVEAEGAAAPLPATAGNDGDFLINPAQPITQFPDRVQTYTTQAGDTPATLAARFNLAIATIMAANGLIDPDAPLEAGKTLTILPFDGTYHVVNSGDTLEGVAQRYQVEPGMITEYKPNRLEQPYTLTPGQALVIPGGVPLPRDTVITYRARPGDTLESVALKFDLDPDTILAANPAVDPAVGLVAGVDLRILPVPGLEVTVAAGDTVEGLAELYRTDPSAITNFGPNHLLGATTLAPGAVLILPGGSVPPPAPIAEPVEEAIALAPALQPSTRGAAQPPSSGAAAPKPPPKATPKPKATSKPPEKAKPATGTAGAAGRATGRFMWPVSGRITQYFKSRHNGLDIAIRAGTPIRAADGGTVVQAGWRRDGLGYAVQIDHGNGYVTIYGHMIRQPPVRAGQLVARGQVIGYIGSTGRSTGPHTHFIIRTPARRYFNPLNFLP